MEPDSPTDLVTADTSLAPMIDSEVLEADPAPAELAAADADAGHFPGQGPAIPSRLNRGMRRAMERKRTRRQFWPDLGGLFADVLAQLLRPIPGTVQQRSHRRIWSH